MPLTVNVGLNRKASENFQSSGLSINLTAELDQSLLAQPQLLQHQIASLYLQAEEALDRQAYQAPAAAPLAPANRDPRWRQTKQSSSQPAQLATPAQRKAIEAISDKLGLNHEQECRSSLNMDYSQLDLRTASQFIDHLKSLQKVGRQ